MADLELDHAVKARLEKTKLTEEQMMIFMVGLLEDTKADRNEIAKVVLPQLAKYSQRELVGMMLWMSERFVDAMRAAREQMELLAITEFHMYPNDAEKLNLPTLGGSLLGQTLPTIDESKCCQTCAFRKGTPANQCFPTVLDASESIAERRPFFCHENPAGGGEPVRVCQGFAQAIKR